MAQAHIRSRRVQLCAANGVARSPEAVAKLHSLGYIVEVEECLDQCTRCESCALALVGGTFAFATTPGDLVRKLR